MKFGYCYSTYTHITHYLYLPFITHYLYLPFITHHLNLPFVTHQLYLLFITHHLNLPFFIIGLQNEDTKEKVMLELLHQLPDANYYTIVYIIEHLVRIAKRSDENKMSLSNLSTIFGPTLMHPAIKETNMDPMVQMARAAKDAEMQTTVIYYFLRLASGGKNLRRSA